MNIVNYYYLGPYTITYDYFLYDISRCKIGSELHVSDHAYSLNKELYERAVEEGYILHKIDTYTYHSFLVVKLPKKPLNEEFINNYYT